MPVLVAGKLTDAWNGCELGGLDLPGAAAGDTSGGPAFVTTHVAVAEAAGTARSLHLSSVLEQDMDDLYAIAFDMTTTDEDAAESLQTLTPGLPSPSPRPRRPRPTPESSEEHRMPEGIFDLHEEAARLDTASTAWADLASGITTASDGARRGRPDGARRRVGGRDRRVVRRTPQEPRRPTSTPPPGLAESLASTLSAAAGSVRICQGRLDQEWAKVASLPAVCRCRAAASTSRPRTRPSAKRADEAVANAQAHRADLDATLSTDTAALNEAAKSLGRCSPRPGLRSRMAAATASTGCRAMVTRSA